ncbi:electron transfer flavoprotein subunit beta/FixA family protein [Chloroflexota bacterium]
MAKVAEMIRVVICMKQVLDPEAPVSTFKVDPEAKQAITPTGTPPVLNPFDENALEAALRIKDTKGAEITVISMGRNLARPVVKKALAAGADELILLESDVFENFDSYSTAYTLANAIKKTGEYDLILCGRQAADTNAGQVGSLIAEILDIPSITIARKIEVDNGKVRVERIVSDGYEVIEATLPALVTVSNEAGELRFPTMTGIIAAQKMSVNVWNAQDIGAIRSQLKRTNLLKLFIPVHEVRCQIIKGESPEEAAGNLALELRKEKII